MIKKERSGVYQMFNSQAMDDIIPLEKVAKYLKLKSQTITIGAQDGRIPAAKPDKEWRFSWPVIDRWFNRHIDEKFSDFLKETPWIITAGIQELKLPVAEQTGSALIRNHDLNLK